MSYNDETPSDTVWTRDEIRDARWMALDLRPVSQEAISWVASVASEITGRGQRTRQRRQQESQEAHRRAVGAILADLLAGWVRGLRDSPGSRAGLARGGLSYRTTTTASFTGQAVPARVFRDVWDGLVGGGWAEIAAEAYNRFGENGSVSRSAARRAPTSRLLSSFQDAGMAFDDLWSHFGAIQGPAVILRGFNAPNGHGRDPGPLLTVPTTGEWNQIRQEVDNLNSAVASTVTVDGCCLPPTFSRRFTHSMDLHGRWYAASGHYQVMKEADRLTKIKIGGEPVVEVDVSASILSALCAYRGCPIPPWEDPYEVRGVPRPLVKAWIVTSIGLGHPRTSRGWPDSAHDVARKEGIDLGAYPLGAVANAIMERHPVIGDLETIGAELAPRLGLDPATRQPQLVSLYLMGLEARALTTAMMALLSDGTVTLPLHDSLIGPRSAAERIKWAMTAAWKRVFDVRPKLTVDTSSKL